MRGAGAYIDAGTVRRSLDACVDPSAVRAIQNNDSFSFFRSAGEGLLMTGPTGTNVADVVFALIR
jgi:glycerate-2-kinase